MFTKQAGKKLVFIKPYALYELLHLISTATL